MFLPFLISDYQRKSAAKGFAFPDPRSSALIRGRAFPDHQIFPAPLPFPYPWE
jgi:hypothetical protein